MIYCCLNIKKFGINKFNGNKITVTRIVHVVAGVLRQNNQVLLTSRPLSKSYAGCWEFPGGKVELGESIIEALIRELKEEIGIKVLSCDCKIITTLLQEYSDKSINLEVIEVSNWTGTPIPCEEQELYFYNLGEVLNKSPLLPTTQRILDLLEKK